MLPYVEDICRFEGLLTQYLLIPVWVSESVGDQKSWTGFNCASLQVVSFVVTDPAGPRVSF